MSLAEFLTEHDILINACLYLFIKMRIIETQCQSVRPFLSHQTDFSDHSFIMVLIVKTLQMINFAFIERRKTYAAVFPNLKLAYISVHIVIIVREILESIDFIHETVLECLSETCV